MLPPAVIESDPGAKVGLIGYGSTHAAMVEARDQLREAGVPTAYCRIRALPPGDEVASFVARHDRVYVVEQNREGQVCTLLRGSLEGTLDDRLVPVTHYMGTPIAAENILNPILDWERTFSDHGPLSNGSKGSAESAREDVSPE